MSTKVCSGCGWVFPSYYRRVTCKFCGAPIEGRIRCSEIPGYDAMKLKRSHEKIRKENDERFDEWVATVSALPFKSLTEDEWLAACRYFDKCAWCGTETIAGRGFFIDYKHGGRYAVWNVLPACEKCCTAIHLQPNPFVRCCAWYGYGHSSKENFNRIVEYLQARIKEITNEH